MAVTEKAVSLTRERLQQIQEALVELGLDAWLLYDFRGNNPIAGGLLGLPPMTRRWFVLIRASGDPVAITHRIEQQPWRGWIGENRPYLTWHELDSAVRELLAGCGPVALEYSAEDGVPYVDRVPAGVLEMVHTAGVTVRSSADLVSTFYSRWSEEGLASHLRAGQVLRAAAHAGFEYVGEALRRGETPTELTVRDLIREIVTREGLKVDADAIVAVNANAANPHYAPSPEAFAPIGREDVLLIDLWGKETPESVYADQTWMAYAGAELPSRLRDIWEAVRDAREAAIVASVDGWGAAGAVTGADLDDAARGVIVDRGFGEYFIHRTGHSLDTALHGSGPNLDNLETRDSRRLIVGVGYTIEPGVYIPGEVGFRSEINMYVGDDGPRVTTTDRQVDPFFIRV